MLGNNGNMSIRGELNTNYAGSMQSSGEDFIIEDRNGNPIVHMDKYGNLYLKGNINENTPQTELNNAMNTKGNFIIQNSAGDVIAYFDETGNLHLLGQIETENKALGGE